MEGGGYFFFFCIKLLIPNLLNCVDVWCSCLLAEVDEVGGEDETKEPDVQRRYQLLDVQRRYQLLDVQRHYQLLDVHCTASLSTPRCTAFLSTLLYIYCNEWSVYLSMYKHYRA